MGIDKDGKLLKLLETFSALTGEQGRVETTVPGDEDHPIIVNEPMSDEPNITTAVSMRQPTDFERYEQLPVNEPDYVPSTSDELARACRIILRDVPNESVAVMWKNIMKLMDKTVDDASIMRTGFEDTQETSKMKSEGQIRQVIRNLIREAGYGRRNRWDTTTQDGPNMDDLDAIERGLDTDTSEIPQIPLLPLRGNRKKDAKVDPADVAADEEEAAQTPERNPYMTRKRGAKPLKPIADQLGTSEQNIWNIVDAAKRKAAYFGSRDEVWFRDMMREFARAYVEELLAAGGRNLTKADRRFLFNTLEDNEALDEIVEDKGFRNWAGSYLNTIYKSGFGKPSK